MEKVIIDSHALFWFLSKNEKLSRKAEHAIKQANQIIVPSIVLMEVLYILEKNKLASRFIEILSEMKAKKYLVHPLDIEIISQTLFADQDLEMHDRIIVATAEIYSAPLITRDKEIRSCYPKTIW